MRVSKEWLQTFIEVDASTEVLSERITRSGIEVDNIIDYTDGVSGLVIGYVKSLKPHPEADKLSVCQVDIGSEVTQIVCGAPNVVEGSYVIVVKPGGTLPGGIHIESTTLRGETSNGMICSLEELGIHPDYVPKEYENGIFMFKDEVPVGEDALVHLYLDDQVLEFDLTPNRKDALSMIGAAHETRALFGGNVEAPVSTIEVEDSDATPVTVRNEDSEACPYYGARIVKGIVVEPSPLFIQMRLIKAGIRPINNVVDISNYVLLEFGQPLHMFDRDKIGSDVITTRYAREGEKMTTLDDKERSLLSTDIVVTNGEEPIALAGVMGGDFSEVSDETVNVVIESAVFDPVSVRKTSQRLNLRSEASSRFEKGVSHEFVEQALDRAAYLLTKYAGGVVASDIISDGVLDLEDSVIETSSSFINNRLGMNLSDKDIEETLVKLGLNVKHDGDDIIIGIPSRRDDLKIPEDITEEVARIYGYDYLNSTLPEYSEITPGRLTDEQKKLRIVKRLLESIGFDQTINYALTSVADSKAFNDKPDALRLLMPMSEERSVLRNSLVPHLLKNVTYNLNRQTKDLALFEIGKIFESRAENEQPKEIEMLACVMTGTHNQSEWLGHGFEADFYAAKGVLEAVVEKLGLTDKVTYKQEELYDELHPGRTCGVYLDGQFVGYIGEVHPKYAKDHDLNRTVVLEVIIEDMIAVKNGTIHYETLPKYPSISRDIALVVDESVTSADLKSVIYEAASQTLKNVYVFDVYAGEHMEAGKKSVAIRLTYLDKEKTLTDEEIEKIHQPILSALEKNGAHLRG